MPVTLDCLAEEIRPILKDIGIIHDCALARLIGVVEDEDDYYYIGLSLQGRRTYYSAVGHCTSLRPGYPAERYAALESLFTLNGGERVAELERAKLALSCAGARLLARPAAQDSLYPLRRSRADASEEGDSAGIHALRGCDRAG